MADRRTLDEELLACLRQTNGYVSGRELSTRFRVTRAAVWKHIKRLRNMGYAIEGMPSTGYRLMSTPDVVHPYELFPDERPQRIGVRVHFLPETGSTNDDAWRLAHKGACEGEVVIAECQTAGKGRRGRTWVSPHGVNLYASIILRPRIPPRQAPLVTLLAAVALTEVLREDYGLQAAIKWPNDVLVQGKKIAGILSEMSAEVDEVHFLIVGIGVNLNMTEEMFPSELLYPATSLYLATGVKVDRALFARSLFKRLDQWYEIFLNEGGAPVRKAWCGMCAHHTQWLEVTTPAGMCAGWFRGLDEEGCLLLEDRDRRVQRISAGDVISTRDRKISVDPS